MRGDRCCPGRCVVYHDGDRAGTATEGTIDERRSAASQRSKLGRWPNDLELSSEGRIVDVGAAGRRELVRVFQNAKRAYKSSPEGRLLRFVLSANGKII